MEIQERCSRCNRVTTHVSVPYGITELLLCRSCRKHSAIWVGYLDRWEKLEH